MKTDTEISMARERLQKTTVLHLEGPGVLFLMVSRVLQGNSCTLVKLSDVKVDTRIAVAERLKSLLEQMQITELPSEERNAILIEILFWAASQIAKPHIQQDRQNK